jgi:hypothetical protein
MPCKKPTACLHEVADFRERSVIFVIHLQDDVFVVRPVFGIRRVAWRRKEGGRVMGCIVPQSVGSIHLSTSTF